MGYKVFVLLMRQLLTSKDAIFDEQFVLAVTFIKKPFHYTLAMHPVRQFFDPYHEQEQTGDLQDLHNTDKEGNLFGIIGNEQELKKK